MADFPASLSCAASTRLQSTNQRRGEAPIAVFLMPKSPPGDKPGFFFSREKLMPDQARRLTAR